MSITYRVSHITRYEYGEAVKLCHNQACLLPRETPYQRSATAQVDIKPNPAALTRREDFFGNRLVYFSIDQPHHALSVTAMSEIELDPPSNQDIFGQTLTWEDARERVEAADNEQLLDAKQYTYPSPLVSEQSQLLAEFARETFGQGRPLVDAASELTARIYSEFTYDPEFTTVSTPINKVIKHKRGVCQDFAHLAISCLRALRLPARYVSGYIENLPPPGETKLQGADATHAWFSVFVPESGWIDFDPTNNKTAQDQHITTAWGRDYSDVPPLKGVIFGGGKNKLAVSVDVKRI